MVVVSYSGKEINAKLVYYGPGLCGKTTNLEHVYDSIPSTNRGKMVSMKTRTERTLFFDFLPVDLGEMGGFKTRFLLYTVPGQVYYNATRKLVLRGVDAVVFVADSARGKMNENLESLENLKENLREYGLDLDTMPWVLQYNKRDLPETYSIEEMNEALNPGGVPHFEAVATNGTGVFDTLKGVSRLLLQKLSKEIKLSPRVADAAADGPKAGSADMKPAAVSTTPSPSTAPLSATPTPAAASAASAAPQPKAAARTASTPPGVRVWSSPPPAASPAATTPSASSAMNPGSVEATSPADARVTPAAPNGFGRKLARLFGLKKKDRESFDMSSPSSSPSSSGGAVPAASTSPAPASVASPTPPMGVTALPRAAVVTSGASTRISRVDPAPASARESAPAKGASPTIEKRIIVPVSLELTSEEIRSASRIRLILDIDLSTMTATVEQEQRTGTR